MGFYGRSHATTVDAGRGPEFVSSHIEPPNVLHKKSPEEIKLILE